MHQVFNHASEEVLRRTAKVHGWTVTGKYEPCEDCQIGHITQKGVSKETLTRHELPGGRLFFDLSSVKKKSLGGNKYWLAVVDDSTGKTWSSFIKKKSELVPVMMKFIRKLKANGHNVERLRCDRAGENFKLEEKCQEELDLNGIKFEFTAARSPQMNGRAERKIAVIWARTRTYLAAAGATEYLKGLLWCECVRHATDIENLLVSRDSEDSAYKLFYAKDLAKAEYLRQFGEIAFIKFGKTIKGKLDDRGIPVMYLGRCIRYMGPWAYIRVTTVCLTVCGPQGLHPGYYPSMTCQCS